MSLANFESVIFVPLTPGGQLKKEIEKAEEVINAGNQFRRLKVVERCGIKLENLI